MVSSGIEKKLLEDIRQIESLITQRNRLPGMKSAAQWERSALLSADRNDLVRLGVNRAFSSVELFMEGIIKNYFIDARQSPRKVKKCQLFESAVLGELPFSGKRALLCKIVRLPAFAEKFLALIEGLQKSTSRSLSEMESGSACMYQGRSIFDLANFKRFCTDAEKASGCLMRHFIKTS
ncbi:MAG TPA: hypothetical protein PKV84_00245 [Candidatus Omnitrophota bacterium]|nr:hypothetical protein [Candidatus Omnitrophota bacterium]